MDYKKPFNLKTNSMNSRRVVITGTGIVSSIGLNTVDFWNSLVECRPGIGPFSSVDPELIRFKNGAEIKTFDASSSLDKNSLDLMDRFTQFAVIASRQGVAESGIIFNEENA